MEIDGKTAYRRTDPGSCRVWLPVTQTFAVRLQSDDACPTLHPYAEAAVELLTNRPDDAVNAEPSDRFIACSLLALALDDPSVAAVEELESLDICSTPTGGKFEVEYEPRPAMGREIAGTPVAVHRDGDSCSVGWVLSSAPIRTPSAPTSVMTGTVTSWDGCEAAEELAGQVIGTTGTERLRAPDVSAVRGLLYVAAESDTAAVGACREIEDPESHVCLPAGRAEAPGAGRELIREGEADPDLVCAAAGPIVREQLGTPWRPVTQTVLPATTPEEIAEAPTQCTFVGNDGEVFEVALSTKPLGASDSELAGHSASTDVDLLLGRAGYVVAWHGAEEPGTLTITSSMSRLVEDEGLTSALVTRFLG
ncbi:hypothetical protein [Nocardioides alcanivorans]|uniref:hypothetical protein n=1 Tax=Nocardioides alcanivorans TaxID=2897352 RepID=UPI001F2315D5|nr:hypothetical protein [Nocardioides alcanivorans]